MRDEHHRTAVAVAAGVGYLLAGVALLLQELEVVALSWAVVLPLLLVAAGTALLLTAGVNRAGRSG
ncbi:hypothetical protein [Actinomycetospora cinnamomea]|uniref:Uncharacterized protein n=1 Tax=Actinomycetospora cinnamomea TaxID=663609 RepID=A0A2U1F285_9PSEU|nr:hypothetical protein [Actinomycetospora cinnamomea]PVZ06295.1 hypothetical protein C8D89_11333 [Actinomycetospora cinnamomea]